jgi:hypothetical protein
MKMPLHHLIICAAFALAPTAFAASVPGLDVTVKKDGKAVYKAKTDASGSFSTGSLEPGSYNVEFRAPQAMKMHSQTLEISVTAGKQPPRKSTAEGKYMQAGVALNVDVSKASKLTGKVDARGGVARSDVGAPAPAGMEKVRANIKVINGKRYVWVPGPIGSNIGGRWVEEGTEGAALSTSNKKGGDTQVLQHIQEQSRNVGQPGG